MPLSARGEILLEAIENFIDAKINWERNNYDVEHNWTYKEDNAWVERATKSLGKALEIWGD